MKFNALKNGIKVILRNWKVFFIYYVFILLIAYILILPADATILGAIAKSVKSDFLLKEFNLAIITEVLKIQFPGLTQIYRGIIPAVIIIVILIILFFAGGSLYAYIYNENDVKKFFSQSANYFWVIFKSALMILLCYIASVALFLLISKIKWALITEKGWEIAHYIITFLFLLILLFMMHFFTMLFDYVKICIVRMNQFKASAALRKAFSFVLHNLKDTLLLYYLIMILEILIIMLLFFINFLFFHAFSSMVGIIISFAIMQLMVIVRIIARLLRYSSQAIMFEVLKQKEDMRDEVQI